MGATASAQELEAWLRALTARHALIELAAVLACVGLAWLLANGLRRGLKSGPGSVLFGERLFDGVAWPLLALVLVLAARRLFPAEMTLAVFRLAVPILTSLLVIRLGVRVLHAAFPSSAFVRLAERSLSWVAWIGVVLWVTGVLPVMLDELDQLTWKVGASQLSLRNLIEGALTAVIVLVLVLWLSATIESKLLSGQKDNLSVRKMAANATRALLMLVGLLVALSVAGIDLTALSVFGGAIGVGLGFGLQKLASNYVSGFVILAERSLRIGDLVKVDNFEGRITDIKTRATVIRAGNGRLSIVPNELLITQRVENASLADIALMVPITLQVVYGTDLDALRPKLLDAILAVERVMKDAAHEPAVYLSNFGPDGLELTAMYGIADPQQAPAKLRSEVNLAILRVLRDEGIEIARPRRLVQQLAPPGSRDEPLEPGGHQVE